MIERDRAPVVSLAPGAESNGFAVMLADLLRQNLEADPAKRRLATRLRGVAAIAVEDAGVALTLRLDAEGLTLLDGIAAIPDLTIRADADTILGLSTMKPLGLLLSDWRREGANVSLLGSVRSELGGLVDALRKGRLKIPGALLHPGLLLGISKLMSIYASGP